MWDKLKIYLKGLAAIAAGGSALAIVTYFSNNGTKIDWHQIESTAIAGAIVALCHYFLQSPLVKKYQQPPGPGNAPTPQK